MLDENNNLVYSKQEEFCHISIERYNDLLRCSDNVLKVEQLISELQLKYNELESKNCVLEDDNKKLSYLEERYYTLLKIIFNVEDIEQNRYVSYVTSLIDNSCYQKLKGKEFILDSEEGDILNP